MKRIMLAAAAAAGLAFSASAARADFGGPVPSEQPAYPGQMMMAGGAVADAGPTCEKYGTLPILRKLMWWNPGGCGAGGCNKGSGKMPAAQQQQPPGMLVFPYHTYNRGPRDFFMWEPGR